jgi:hypothetical protein
MPLRLFIPVLGTHQRDIQIWKATANGTFTVCSAYYLAKERENQQTPESSFRAGDYEVWMI